MPSRVREDQEPGRGYVYIYTRLCTNPDTNILLFITAVGPPVVLASLKPFRNTTYGTYTATNTAVHVHVLLIIILLQTVVLVTVYYKKHVTNNSIYSY